MLIHKPGLVPPYWRMLTWEDESSCGLLNYFDSIRKYMKCVRWRKKILTMKKVFPFLLFLAVITRHLCFFFYLAEILNRVCGNLSIFRECELEVLLADWLNHSWCASYHINFCSLYLFLWENTLLKWKAFFTH